jgi:hypothetical protein
VVKLPYVEGYPCSGPEDAEGRALQCAEGREVMSMVVLYVLVCAAFILLIAVLGAAISLKHNTDVPIGRVGEWGPPGIGKQVECNNNLFDCMAEPMSCGDWSYASAYDPEQTVYFDDPFEAYEYVLGAVKEKNRVLDRLENTQYNGMPSSYEWLWMDTHYEREYWMSELNEFKEDCDGQI